MTGKKPKHPPLSPLKSSAITGYHYDPATETLHLGFASGGVHSYGGVDPKKAASLAQADSVGSFFHKHIWGVHPDKKVADDQP